MGLREITLGGVMVSPMLVFALLALPLTFLLRLGLQRTPLANWIWHESLFDCALYVCVLAALVALLGRW